MSRREHTSKPMHLEFDKLHNPIGKFSNAYGIQISTYATKVNIDTKSYPSMNEVDNNKLWEETKAIKFLKIV